MAQLQSREVVAKEMDLNRPISRCAKFGVGRGLSIILWSYCDPLGEIMVAPPLHGEESRTDSHAVAAQLREASRFRRSAGLFASFPLVHPGLSKAHDLSGAPTDIKEEITYRSPQGIHGTAWSWRAEASEPKGLSGNAVRAVPKEMKRRVLIRNNCYLRNTLR